MRLRNLAFVAVLFAATPARADFGIGLFLGEPTGLDLKLGLGNRSSLDLLFGWHELDYDNSHYVHVTYLLTPVVSEGRSVVVPLRIGIGLALADDAAFHSLHAAVRLPLELGLRFRSVPLEIYGEVSFLVWFGRGYCGADTACFDLDGGLGIRFYF
jgi:hypothetical protein